MINPDFGAFTININVLRNLSIAIIRLMFDYIGLKRQYIEADGIESD